MKLTRSLRNVPIAVAILGSFLSLHWALAAESRPDSRPALQVPATDSTPVVDGKLDDPCWKDAAKTGPLTVTQGESAQSTTEAFILRDAEHLYVGVSCAWKDAEVGDVKPGDPSKEVGFIDLLIDSNGDRNSYYLIRITAEGGGNVTCSYNELDPPWYDPAWQPQFKFAAARGTGVWVAEFALPFDIFNKNKTLAPEVGFNIRRSGVPGGETHCWCGPFLSPGEWGILTGVPARESLPMPDYAKLGRGYRPPAMAMKSFLAGDDGQTIRLGPGSAHPGTTGEVKLELEGFLLAGDPHARGIIWDLAVDEQKGKLYVLSDSKSVLGVPEIRVFNRRGEYLRTIMPLNPTLPGSSVQDICRKTAREGQTELVIPILLETRPGELSMYGAWWSLPQKMALAPNGDLILSNIYRGTLWRMRPDGGLPLEGWTSAYHRGRNEPFRNITRDYILGRVEELKT